MGISDHLRKLANDIDSLAQQKSKIVKTRFIDNPDKETIIIGALKKVGLPYRVAKRLFDKHGPEYIARKIFLLEYKKTFDKETPIKSVTGWLTTAVEDDFDESDHFIDWLKCKRDNINPEKGEARIEFRRLIQLT